MSIVPPGQDLPATRLRVRGWASMVCVFVFFIIATFVSVFTLWLDIIHWSRVQHFGFQFAGHVLRAVGTAVLTALLWRYQLALKRFNAEGEAAANRLESAHTVFWRWLAVFLLVNMIHTVIVVVRPYPRPQPAPEAGTMSAPERVTEE